MAFGFFKKTITADTIFHNGHIFTQDPELPWADAVAVKDEAIPSSVEVLGNFRRLHFFLALMSHTTCPAILDFSTKILCPFWAFFY